MDRVQEVEVGPFLAREEYDLMLDYFYKSDDIFLRGMGVDQLKLPERDKWLGVLLADDEKPDSEKDRFYLIWIFRGERVGHASVNKIAVGIEAPYTYALVGFPIETRGSRDRICAPISQFLFRAIQCEELVCEPWADNPAPNRVLEKLGFAFVGRYRTTPGIINYEQDVNRYELRRPDEVTQRTADR